MRPPAAHGRARHSPWPLARAAPGRPQVNRTLGLQEQGRHPNEACHRALPYIHVALSATEAGVGGERRVRVRCCRPGLASVWLGDSPSNARLSTDASPVLRESDQGDD